MFKLVRVLRKSLVLASLEALCCFVSMVLFDSLLPSQQFSAMLDQFPVFLG